MAQVIPSITSLPLDSSAAPSVEDIQDRLPSICVDYLSHDWLEEDVWASWRNMTRHKHEIANGVRLENASWRTWQKQRNKLKTISPETLNWLKDSDVTWLYGPLHTAAIEPVRPLRVAATDERLGLDKPVGAISKPDSPGLSPATSAVTGVPKKPILKHRTLSEMLAIHTPSSPILEAHGDDTDSDDEGLERPSLLQTKSDTNIVRSRGGVSRKRSPPRGPISSGKHTPAVGSGTATPPEQQAAAASSKRHISFNTFVEQCVAVDDPSDIPAIEESDDEMLEMRSSSSSRSSRPSMSRNSSTSSAEHLTIAKIAPTTLKTPLGTPAKNAPPMVYAPPPEYLSPGPSAGSQGFDFPSPVVENRRWQEDSDMYGSVGVDYFGGPDLGGGERVQHQVQQTGSSPRTAASPSYGRAPTVGQPPSQPKWRQPNSHVPGSVDSSTSASSSSSSQSLNQQTVTSPTQTKGILKVRAPSSDPAPEPSSPPSSYFNYNPSAATGIGGMRGAQYMDQPGPAGSPASPGQHQPQVEERGRSRVHTRDRGSSAYDRSASRTTSSTASSSMSPGTSRSPVGQSRRPQQQQSGQQASIHQQQYSPSMQQPSQQGQMWEPGTPDYEMKEFADEKSETPTPHSSPQISFRPLKDTSASSLPHRSTSPSSLPHVSTRPSSENLPKTDPPKTVSPQTSTPPLPGTASSPNPASAQTSGPMKPTIAQTSTTAEPTLAQQSQQDVPSSTREGQTSPLTAQRSLAGQRRSSGGGSSFGAAGQALANATASGEMSRGASDSGIVGGPLPQSNTRSSGGSPAESPNFVGGDDAEDGSTIMGRAANIASTAKDLLGALWYGANEGQQQGQRKGGHKRGASLG